MKRREFLRWLLAAGGFISLGGFFFEQQSAPKTVDAALAEPEYYRLLVLGDPHLPLKSLRITDGAKRERVLAAKQQVIKDIQSWQDISRIAVVGDIAAQFGIAEEYAFARQYFSPLAMPLDFITGNHDFIYEDQKNAKGHFVLCSPENRQKKLRAFQETFQLPALSYAHTLGNYQLIYLSADTLTSPHLAELQPETLVWFEQELARHPERPTLVFFHAPLNHTLETYNKTINTPSFIAQPEASLRQLIEANPQIKLWVSGHTHTPATNPSYAAAINRYDNRVENIHNPDMDRETIWTNSLYLYPNEIRIRTYNHHTQQWESSLDRTIPI